jgi:hypothetical protein
MVEVQGGGNTRRSRLQPIDGAKGTKGAVEPGGAMRRRVLFDTVAECLGALRRLEELGEGLTIAESEGVAIASELLLRIGRRIGR